MHPFKQTAHSSLLSGCVIPKRSEVWICRQLFVSEIHRLSVYFHHHPSAGTRESQFYIGSMHRTAVFNTSWPQKYKKHSRWSKLQRRYWRCFHNILPPQVIEVHLEVSVFTVERVKNASTHNLLENFPNPKPLKSWQPMLDQSMQMHEIMSDHGEASDLITFTFCFPGVHRIFTSVHRITERRLLGRVSGSTCPGPILVQWGEGVMERFKVKSNMRSRWYGSLRLQCINV